MGSGLERRGGAGQYRAAAEFVLRQLADKPIKSRRDCGYLSPIPRIVRAALAHISLLPRFGAGFCKMIAMRCDHAMGSDTAKVQLDRPPAIEPISECIVA